MAGGGKEAATQHASPKAIGTRKEFARRSHVKIENLKLAEGLGDLHNVRPAAGNLLQQNVEAQERTSDIKSHLNYVRPDHRRHTTLIGINQGEDKDYDDRGHF